MRCNFLGPPFSPAMTLLRNCQTGRSFVSSRGVSYHAAPNRIRAPNHVSLFLDQPASACWTRRNRSSSEMVTNSLSSISNRPNPIIRRSAFLRATHPIRSPRSWACAPEKPEFARFLAIREAQQQMGLWVHDDLLQIQLDLHHIAIDEFRLVETKFL
jgi:hypothetical protein